MYDTSFLGTKEMQKLLGLGRDSVMKLCRERPHNFPVVRIGSRYQADEALLTKWKDDWYSGKFEIDFRG